MARFQRRHTCRCLKRACTKGGLGKKARVWCSLETSGGCVCFLSWVGQMRLCTTETKRFQTKRFQRMPGGGKFESKSHSLAAWIPGHRGSRTMRKMRKLWHRDERVQRTTLFVCATRFYSCADYPG